MTSQSWRSLLNKKYQLSLRLFLFLNAASAMFSVTNPLYSVRLLSVPLFVIFTLSAGLLFWHWKYASKKINIPVVSTLFGFLWAWQIAYKFSLITHNHATYLMLALLSVLFIGSLAFASNIKAFTLHSLPTFITCLWLSNHEEWLRMTYSLALPMVAIGIHHVLQRRNDHFAQQLLYQLLEERETLTDLSMMDPLTGLYNRRGLQSRLKNLPAPDTGEHFVLLLDIDHFKAYNDHYGHMMGDQALIRVSAAIRDAVRSRDIVARFGGEEFMVLLTNISLENARQTAERIRQKVYDLKIPHMFNESVATNVTISIGIAIFEGEDVEIALEKADKALYEAKHMGRNNILLSEELETI
ncbi:GGDEF domain-containing protein [Enterobacter sp. RHBSTW-00994]|uniref:GGDEF domain-containing protein n=1 Tax=Enterobacter sp. RHBSTW-00994 TaxID=2742676 RepID=UPI0015E945B1|nr:GGDEF domain-containing protein [Enterobacter sp. RHBSTW-00994]QLR41723.1 GGDEF domain-containing protein [Enterobacter sp. RHBSTW-00994]